MSYLTDAHEDACDMVRNFEDEIVNQLLDDGEASEDLFNDYGGDSYHHENHVDKYYDLTEAAAVLDELSDYEETDSGLWHGLEPRDAIAAQAAYTYGNAVLAEWRELIDAINETAGDRLRELQAAHEDADADAADAVEEQRGELLAKIDDAEENGASDEELLALDEELEAIADYDPTDHEAAREDEKRAALTEIIKECLS